MEGDDGARLGWGTEHDTEGLGEPKGQELRKAEVAESATRELIVNGMDTAKD